MKKILFSLLAIGFLFISPIEVVAQTPQELQQQMKQAVDELKKQIAEQEKSIADAKKNKEDAETIKGMENDLVQLKQQLAMMERAGKSVASIPTSMMKKASDQVNAENDITPSGIPAKKTALLNALPKDNLSTAELTVFLTTLHNDLEKKLPKQTADVQKIIAALKNDAVQIAYTGVAAWYSQSPAQAALLLTYAASKSPDDANTLNNCGAILNLCGKEEKAIPILKYVLISHPDNSTVLNNLGQAYAGLGDKQTAMMYFGRCIRQSPDHPEANATAAKIEESNGNIDKALEYTEASLRGAFSEERSEFFNQKKKSCSIRIPFNTQHTTVTKFFDPGALHIPPNCRNWNDGETVYPQQEQYFEMIDNFIRSLGQKVLQNQVTQAEIVTMGESPFNKAALFKKGVIGECYTERKQELFEKLMEDIRKLTEQTQAEQRKWQADCDAATKACGTNIPCQDRASYNCCRARVAVDNKYFSLLADISEKYTQNNFTEDVGYYNSLVYLEAISSTNEKVLAATCGAYAVTLLGQFKTYVLSTQCNPSAKPDCEQLNPANQQNPSLLNFKDAQCPINLKIPMGAMKVSLSCKKFGIEVGQGVKFGYEKDFITRESTLSMGVGVDADIPGILDAKAKEKVFVKFDANNQPIDVGLSAEASIGIKGTPPIASAGYTMGVNSGFNYHGSSMF